MMTTVRRTHPAVVVLLTAAAFMQFVGRGRADSFTYRDQDGQTQTVEARLAASGQGAHLLEKADGQMLLIPQPAVSVRDISAGPEPISADEMAARLTERFGEENLRTLVDAPYVVGLVLAGPLPPRSEIRVTGFLKKAARFLHNVETVFDGFCRDMRIPTEDPRFPLVTLIFESDDDFNAYAREATGGQGLSAESISGFYSALTNWLALRMGECRSFQVPLHEAIHQQVFNRGLLQRLADVPVWFNEGIATGFENDGERINIGPNKINTTYARLVPEATRVDWQNVVSGDASFRGDVLASEAYVHAWSLHWMLVTEYRREYAEYLGRLRRVEPLEEQTPEQRQQDFEECFRKSIAELQADFPRLLEAGLKRQRVNLRQLQRPGHSRTFGESSEVELTAVRRLDQGGMIEVQGALRNVNPFRSLAYHVLVVTDAGTYAEWVLPNLASHKAVPLKKQLVLKQVAGSPGGAGEQFTVRVKAALPDSEQVQDWKRGNTPLPSWEP